MVKINSHKFAHGPLGIRRMPGHRKTRKLFRNRDIM